MTYENAEYSEATKARASLERREIERNSTISIVTKDNSNEASFPGFPYRLKARGSSIIVNVDLFKSGYECKTCKGTGKLTRKGDFIPGEGSKIEEIKCEDCKGIGHLLVLADETKSLPCTGVVVSMGTGVDNNDLHLYDRVIFGPYSGRFIPISKAGVMMKIMDQREATAVVLGGEDLAAFDFIDIEKGLGE